MGGSGGGGFFYERSKSPEEIAKKIRTEEEASQSVAFDGEVLNIIRNALADVNNRDVETIQQHLTIIEKAIHSEIEGSIDLRYGGSVSKHTYVDGLSDIDSLAILNNSELANARPEKVKQYFYDSLQKRLPNTVIEMGKLAVTVKFSDGTEIQILPALKTPSGIKIASSRRDDAWSNVIHAENFAKVLRFTNTKMSGKLVPVIKLAKSIISSFAENRRVAGYHTECLAIEVFSEYSGEKTPKAMLKHFFNEGAKSVLSPIRDRTGQSIHVDDYLGSANSLNRKMVSDSMSTIARKMQNADGSREIRIWQQFLK